MDSTDDLMQRLIIPMDLDDDELLFAYAHLRMAEALATFRRDALFASILLVAPSLVLPTLFDDPAPAKIMIVHLAQVMGTLGPIMLLIALIISVVGSSLLNKDLAGTAFADQLKDLLRRLAADIEIDVFKRPIRRLVAWYNARNEVR